jgi:branched-chain amino acid transport system ATP-binding protein
MTSAILSVDGVAKRFGALVVIDEMSFAVSRGEAVGIVGPNGAGKTTMLNMIAGDFAPSRGTIHFEGVDVTAATSAARCRAGIARTSQIPRPFEGLTVYENVLVGATFGRGNRKAKHLDVCIEALERAGMTAKGNVAAGALTLLERKRLELARALSTGPTLLLLDEIAGGLTEGEVLELVDTVEAIHDSGVTIVWIEHIVHALLKVVDRIVAMDYGRKLIEGDPHEVMASAEVANVYLGAE